MNLLACLTCVVVSLFSISSSLKLDHKQLAQVEESGNRKSSLAQVKLSLSKQAKSDSPINRRQKYAA